MAEHAVITLPSRFDSGYQDTFQQQCKTYIAAQDVSDIIFDFKHVEYLDSAALGLMIMWQYRAAAANKKMYIQGAKGATADILSVANVRRMFDYL